MLLPKSDPALDPSGIHIQGIAYGCAAILLSILLMLPARSYGMQGVPADTLNLQQHPVTITQAIQVALANNTEIKRALFSLKDADQQVRIAWSEVLPDISGNASYTRNIELPVIFFPDQQGNLQAIQIGDDNNWVGTISVEQILFRGEAFVGINTSQLFKAAQAENVRATTQQIVTDTRTAYYNVLVAKEELRLQQASVDRLRENLEENRARYRAGLVDEFAVLQVEVQLSNQLPELTRAEYTVREARRELLLVMGLPVELQIETEGDLSDYDILSEIPRSAANREIKELNQMTPYRFEKTENMISMATGMRGDIRVLEKRNELKDREIRAIRSRYIPTLSTSYNLGWRAEEPGALDFFGNDLQRVRTQSVSFNLSVPIFQGLERDANLQIAKIEKKDLEIQKEFAVRAAQNQIQTARESLNQSIETASAREEAIEQAREGYERALARLENGLGSQIEVIEAEFQLRQAERNYARMVYNYLTAKARYDLAIGMVPFVDRETPKISE
ncbi:MAG: TolC family protein [Balneolaceae bacterium]|nr:TolC family protein [Balneolaceae bacterium]